MTKKAKKKTEEKSGEIVVSAGPSAEWSLIRDELARLSDEKGGRLDPADVVESARDLDSPMHPKFTWDDGVAAERYRLMQAGALIRRIKVTIIRSDPETRQLKTDKVREYESPGSERDEKRAPTKGGSYLPSSKIAKDPALREALVRTVLGELIAIKKRYKNVSELDAIWRAIDDADGALAVAV